MFTLVWPVDYFLRVNEKRLCLIELDIKKDITYLAHWKF